MAVSSKPSTVNLIYFTICNCEHVKENFGYFLGLLLPKYRSGTNNWFPTVAMSVTADKQLFNAELLTIFTISVRNFKRLAAVIH